MVMTMYLKRYIENEIKDALEASGVVVISGPKFCGKTTTSKVFAKSMYALDTKKKIELAQTSPEGILIGEVPRLIDECKMFLICGIVHELKLIIEKVNLANLYLLVVQHQLI